jgi:hypothetical protein
MARAKQNPSTVSPSCRASIVVVVVDYIKEVSNIIMICLEFHKPLNPPILIGNADMYLPSLGS